MLAGAGERAFCTGGDQSAHDGNYDGRGTIGLPMEELHTAIRDVPKPVIARVQGFAIGGGNVLCTICDLTICSEKAIFGQVGPKMGSVDPGYGTAFLARVVGEKKAREIWYMCRRYSGAEAAAMGLANACVPHEQLDAEVQKWAEELCERSPTALAIAKRSFNMDTAHQAGIAGMGMLALKMYYDTEESRVARGRHCAEGKAQAGFSQVCEVSGPKRGTSARCRAVSKGSRRHCHEPLPRRGSAGAC